MKTVNIAETFESIQGESSYAGLPCFFIRLSGCNLRCNYCDTTHAYEAGEDVKIWDLVKRCMGTGSKIVEITGGEPLLQEGFVDLAQDIHDQSAKLLLVETNGSQDISIIPEGVIAIVDVKCPGSGAEDTFDIKNVERLRPYDEVKFVLSDKRDYDWAVKFKAESGLNRMGNTIYFSPVFEKLKPAELADWIIRDGLQVKLQVQLHKMLGVK